MYADFLNFILTFYRTQGADPASAIKGGPNLEIFQSDLKKLFKTG